MNEEMREKQKKMGIKRFFHSFMYSVDGLKYAFTHEQSMLIHSVITVFVVTAGIILKLNIFEWLICLLVIGLVIVTELINTSIEAVVDLSCPEINPLAKIAKDTASAAVLIFAITAFICGILIFLPKVIIFLSSI